MQVSSEDYVHGDTRVLLPTDIIVKEPSWSTASRNTSARFSSSSSSSSASVVHHDHHHHHHHHPQYDTVDLREDPPQRLSRGNFQVSTNSFPCLSLHAVTSPAMLPSPPGNGMSSSLTHGIRNSQCLSGFAPDEEEDISGYEVPPIHCNNDPVICHGVDGDTENSHGFSGDPHGSVVTTASNDSCKKWSFHVIASLQAKPCSLASDVIGAIDFDESGSFFATGGIARKIRVYSFKNFTENLTQETMPEEEEEEGEEESDYEEDEEDEDDDYAEERHTVALHRPSSSLSSSSSSSSLSEFVLETSNQRRARRRGRLSCSRSKRKIVDRAKIHGGHTGRVVNHDEASSKMICTPAKLSSLKWRPLMGGHVIGCGDYDGVVTEWDVEQGLCLSERDEHSGQRIWSIDYSRWFPTLCASASGDCTVRLWNHNSERSVGVIKSPGNSCVCCAEFSPDGTPKVAMACADSNIFLYDLRRLDSSLLCLQGHERATSYVRFLGDDELVSASIDSTVRLWDVGNLSRSHNPSSYSYSRNRFEVFTPSTSSTSSSSSSSASSIYAYKQAGIHSNRRSFMSQRRGSSDRMRIVFGSHRNAKNFVGLSVLSNQGLIACGSEDNELYVYERSGSKPLWRMKFPSFPSDQSSEKGKKWRGHPYSTHEEQQDSQEVTDGNDECMIKMYTRSDSNGIVVDKANCTTSRENKREGSAFVGAVCWGPPLSGNNHSERQQHSLVTANSQGTVQLVMVHSGLYAKTRRS